ncbi:MAG: ATP-binding protein [Epsilonproteobacteria bacterium]|nr:ATP-binding protein [Campylobacterota bacterium]
MAVFGVISLIIVILFSYVWGYESNLMLKKEQEALQKQSLMVAEDLDVHLNHLQKEILFLSCMEVMNDMLTRDLDKRISKILEQKADDLGESITLFTVEPDGTIPLSSNINHITGVFKEANAIKNAVKSQKTYLFLGKNLYIFTPMYGSFYTHGLLGYLVMSYPLKNFELRLKTDQKFYRWLSPPAIPSISYPANIPMLNSNDYLYHSIPLHGVLKGWILHYAMPKNEALSLLYHFQTLFLSAFGIGLALIAFLVWIIVLRIIKPLRELSDTAMRISTTGDYSQTVAETALDEIGIMAHAFNALMFTTLANIKHLEYEREKHAEKLVSLIGFFNAITRTDTKEATIAITMDQIRRFSNAKEVYFSLEGCDTNDITIALNAVGNETPGVICIQEPALNKEANERFYAALERMLALQMERIELLGKTQAALKAKSAFLSAMSHELRTPIGSILSLIQYTMIQPQTPDPILVTLGKIENSAYHLLSVINNVLDLAKAESGKMEPHIIQCNPMKLIKDALELVSPLAEEKGLHVTTTFEAAEAVFRSDERLFKQVVINLLSNAIKYTEEGTIDIQLHNDQGVFILRIRDSGRGIVPEALVHLFDEFYQVHSIDPSGLKGSGLGLAISKHIAHLLQGDLSITSEGEGMGTTATFRFRSL